jgi:hypothetical protein
LRKTPFFSPKIVKKLQKIVIITLTTGHPDSGQHLSHFFVRSSEQVERGKKPSFGNVFDFPCRWFAVDVMIAIFGDFCQFSAKKMGVFSQKPMLRSSVCKNLQQFEQKKRRFFREIFLGENILKVITSSVDQF